MTSVTGVFLLHINAMSCYIAPLMCFLYSNVLHQIHSRSYMSAHVLLNKLNKLGKRDKMLVFSSILSLFRKEINEFNNTSAQTLGFIYHMTLRLL